MSSLQVKAEQKVYSILEDLENELEISNDKIPEVYYVGKNFSLNKIGLPEEFIPMIKTIKKNNSAFAYSQPPLIFTTTLNENHLGEEVGHYIHFNYINPSRNNLYDYFSFDVLKEMLGFFASKLIDSKRQNPYGKIEDWFPIKLDLKKSTQSFEKLNNCNPNQYKNAFYIQGYSLGERMFNNYISGNLNKSKIKEIFTHPLDKDYDSLHQFMEWKYEVLI